MPFSEFNMQGFNARHKLEFPLWPGRVRDAVGKVGG